MAFTGISERLSLFVARRPRAAILAGIIIFNIVFLLIATALIYFTAPPETQEVGYWGCFFYTVSMILDAGCVQYVVNDANTTSAFVIVLCLVVVLIGIISFMGAIIGYVTNWITEFIANSNAGTRPLKVSGHTVILNWNSRATEIVNDMLYSMSPEKVVILVEDGKDDVERAIEERLNDTIEREGQTMAGLVAGMSKSEARKYRKTHSIRNKVTVVVRQGSIYSMKQLQDICIAQAKSVIILGADTSGAVCKYRTAEERAAGSVGNTLTIKTLIQVADLTSDESSADSQRIVVEAEDDWTDAIVTKVIESKERLAKCAITSVPTNRVLGCILSQLVIMPQLNEVYSELFSNRGAFFASADCPPGVSAGDEVSFLSDYLATHSRAIPLSLMHTKQGVQCFFMVNDERDIFSKERRENGRLDVSVRNDFAMRKRNVLIIGTNNKLEYIMDGFDSYCAEWRTGADEILDIHVIIDPNDERGPEFYDKYAYVTRCVRADVHDADGIAEGIRTFLAGSQGEQKSILMLSDDRLAGKDTDANVLSYLVYVEEALREYRSAIVGNDRCEVDTVIEILDPRNYDVVSSYSASNIVISNRYISKMVTQVSEKKAIYDFYTDILTYDEEGATDFESKELYIKRAGDFFVQMPGECTANELVDGVYEACLELSDRYVNQTLLLGYFRDGEMRLFAGEQLDIPVQLSEDDRLVILSNH